MTVTVDCRMIGASGIGVYLCGCLPYLVSGADSVLCIGNGEKIRNILRDTELNSQHCEIIDCGIKPFSVREILFFPRSILKKINASDAYYSPYCNIPGGITTAVYTTIHDIIFPDMPELTSRTGLFARMWFYKRARVRSKKIFTVSEFSKSRIEYFLGTSVPVVVTHNAPQPWLLNRDTNTDKKRNILFIGNIKKHKGLSTLLTAFSAARSRGLEYTLTVVGSRDNFRSSDTGIVSALNNTGNVEFTGFIPDGRLKTLLAQAALLVQPSLYEGFGYPPLEAMMQGTRALISDIPVFREVYGDFPVEFFRAGDPDDLANSLMRLLHGKEPETLTLSDTLKNKYSFKKTADIILNELSPA